MAAEAKHYLEECRLYREPNLDTETPPPVDDKPLQRFLDKLTATEEQLVELKASRLPRLVRGGAWFWITLGLLTLFVAPAGYLSDWLPLAMGIAAAVALLLGGGISGWIYFQARSTALRVYDALCQTILDGETARQQWFDQATEKYQREQNEIKRKYESDLQRAADIYNAAKDAAKLSRQLESQSIEETYPVKMAEVQTQFNAATTQASAEHAAKNADILKGRNDRLRTAQQEFERGQAECESRYQSDWQTVGDQWCAGLRSVYAAAQQLNLKLDERYPDWNAADWETWIPPTNVAPAIRIGQFEVGLEQIPGGLSEDPRLAADVPPSFQLPAMLSFPNRGSMVLKVAGSAARSQGVDVLQSVMLRYPDGHSAGKSAVHDRRSCGLGAEFRRLHASFGLRRVVGLAQDLDRATTNRAAARRPHGPHGQRHSEVFAQRIRNHRRLQRACRRSGRAVPHPGGGEFSVQLYRSGHAHLLSIASTARAAASTRS